ncbi:MAG: CvpA family protein [Planctomycetota bacterium]
MSALDVVAGILSAVAGWIGFRQGLSVILLRCAIVSVGCLGLRWFQPPVAELIGPHVGSWTPFASVALVFLGVLVVQELAAWLWRAMRDALLLGLPDRLAGLAVGLLAGAALVGVGGTIMKGAGPSWESTWQASHMRPLLEKAEPWIKNNLTPETLTRGKERLKNLVH